MADECSAGGDHVEGAPQDAGDVRQVRCTKCQTVLSTGMIPKPGDPDSDR